MLANAYNRKNQQNEDWLSQFFANQEMVNVLGEEM